VPIIRKNETLKTVRWTSDDKPGLKLHDEAMPNPGPHEVVVRVYAASLNFRDQAILDGAYGGPTKPNGVPLSDGAGEVIAVGRDVKRTKVGDRVSASCCQHWIGGPTRPE
jgi:NADPH:quinone reductase-like Zn-dependent oxidoreductase